MDSHLEEFRKKSAIEATLHRLLVDYRREHFFGKVYAFSRKMNPLDYDPTYPRNPTTLAQHIRKFRKDKGLTMGEFAREIGVHEFTVINWEVRGKIPRVKNLRERLTREVERVGAFFQT